MEFEAQKKPRHSRIGRREITWGFIFLSPWIIGFLAFTLIPMVASFIFTLYNFNLVDPDMRVVKAEITEQTLEKLQGEGLPENILSKLRGLGNQVFKTKDETMAAVKTALGEVDYETYKKQVWAQTETSSFLGFSNWVRMFTQDTEVFPAIRKIFHFSLIALPLGLGFALFLAILLNSEHLVGTNFFRSFFFMPTMIPLVATTLIWAGVLNEYTGWVNLFIEGVSGVTATGTQGIRWLNDPRLVYWSYAFMGFWGTGYAMLIFLAGLQNIPTELYEAAYVDGAGWFRRLWYITMPMLTPVIFYNLTISVILSMQYFLVPYVLTGGTGYPQGSTNFIYIYFYRQAFSYFNMGYGATLAWLIFLIGLTMTLVLFGTARYWVYYAGEKA